MIMHEYSRAHIHRTMCTDKSLLARQNYLGELRKGIRDLMRNLKIQCGVKKNPLSDTMVNFLCSHQKKKVCVCVCMQVYSLYVCCVYVHVCIYMFVYIIDTTKITLKSLRTHALWSHIPPKRI